MASDTSESSDTARVPVYPGRVDWGCNREGQFCGVCAVGIRVDYCGPWLPTKEEALEDALHWIYEHGYRHPLAAGKARFGETRISGLTVPADRAGEQLHQQELFGQAEDGAGPYGPARKGGRRR